MPIQHPTDWPPLSCGDPWLTSRSHARVKPERHELALARYLDEQMANRAKNFRPGLLSRLIGTIQRRVGNHAAGPRNSGSWREKNRERRSVSPRLSRVPDQSPELAGAAVTADSSSRFTKTGF